MIHFFLFLQMALATETLKTEFPGCPENSLCKKETGIIRSEWLEILGKFEQKSIDEKEANRLVQSRTGIPIPAWASEEASKKPLTILWDSPCKQHKTPTNKTYIAVTFLKNLLPKNNILFHAPAVILDDKKVPHLIMVLRGDAPLFISNDSLYYTQDDEGHYYGLLVAPSGRLSLTHILSDTHYPKEISCTLEQIEMFKREIPSPDFFQGYYCKSLWNTKTKNYQSILIGWSCN
jgi:hypothetical protein